VVGLGGARRNGPAAGTLLSTHSPLGLSGSTRQTQLSAGSFDLRGFIAAPMRSGHHSGRSSEKAMVARKIQARQ
jgi:hypothetical protein